MKRYIIPFSIAIFAVLVSSCIEINDPRASFSMSSNTAEINEIISFTNKSIYANYHTWDFGDGYTSTETHPRHHYSNYGIYTVNLDVEGTGGNDYTSAEILVYNIVPGEIIEDFYLGNTLYDHFQNYSPNYTYTLTTSREGNYYIHSLYFSNGITLWVDSDFPDIYDDDIPFAITASARFGGLTEQDVSFGDRLSYVENRYGYADYIDEYGSLYYDYLGIGFWSDIETETKVAEIEIYYPLKSTKKSTRTLTDKRKSLRELRSKTKNTTVSTRSTTDLAPRLESK
ncbi:PKD domain-containing protein [bacterium]|nr:PKD domain-containing protein [bacterium]